MKTQWILYFAILAVVPTKTMADASDYSQFQGKFKMTGCLGWYKNHSYKPASHGYQEMKPRFERVELGLRPGTSEGTVNLIMRMNDGGESIHDINYKMNGVSLPLTTPKGYLWSSKVNPTSGLLVISNKVKVPTELNVFPITGIPFFRDTIDLEQVTFTFKEGVFNYSRYAKSRYYANKYDEFQECVLKPIP